MDKNVHSAVSSQENYDSSGFIWLGQEKPENLKADTEKIREKKK